MEYTVEIAAGRQVLFQTAATKEKKPAAKGIVHKPRVILVSSVLAWLMSVARYAVFRRIIVATA